MKFMMGYYRQKGTAEISLLVQQYEFKGEQMCFACLCGGGEAGGYFSGQLLQWFRRLPMKQMLRQKEQAVEKLKESCLKKLHEIDREISGMTTKIQTGFGGIICLGEYCMIFHRGEIRGVLVQNFMGHGYVRDLWQGRQLEVECFLVEPGVGVFLTTEELFEGLQDRMLQDGLYAERFWGEEQIRGHLRELICEAQRRGADGSAGVMLRSLSEGEMSAQRRPKDQAGAPTQRKVATAQMLSQYETQPRLLPQSIQQYRKGRELEEGFLNLLYHRGYRLGRCLGEGAFAKVYLVEDRKTGEAYACKISNRAELLEKEFLGMEEQEHPIFLKAKEFFREWENGFLVMEYVAGSTVSELLAVRRRFSAKQVVRVGMELAEALVHLQQGSTMRIFRDIKPENIMIRQDGRVKLLDFGCVCELEEGKSRAGSPGFSAPEQFLEEGALSLASDVYGLGKTLEAMLGEDDRMPPKRWQSLFKRKCEKMQGFQCRRNKRWRRERGLRRALCRVIYACTNVEPSQRLPDMQAVMTALTPLCEYNTDIFLRRKSVSDLVSGIVCEKNIWESDYKTLDV